MSSPHERESIVQIGDKSYTIASDDLYLDSVGRDFEPHMVGLFRSLIRRDDSVVDVGANIGLTTLLFAELAARVYSFEASPSTFRYLKRNVEHASLSNVTLINKALGNRTTTSEITFAPNNRSGGFVSDQTKASAGHVTETIDVRRMDDLLPRGGDFVKLDVEGYEKYVIEGAPEILAKNRPVVVLELNHWCLNAFQRITVPDFFDFLRATFPIALAVQDHHYLNLHDSGESYITMYRHIVQGQYSNLVCAFDPERLQEFKEKFRNG